MAVTVDEQETPSSEDPDNSSGSRRSSTNLTRFKCPFCDVMYNQLPAKKCDHLVCEVEYVESTTSEFVSVPDHPIVASLFRSMEVPRVIAGRFMHFLRTAGGASTVDNQGVKTLDLIPRTTPLPVVTIKYSHEDAECFREWTYYLTSDMDAAKRLFVPFVQKYYSPQQPTMIPFSRICIGPEAMTLQAEDLLGPDRCAAGNWVMMTGFPDEMPLFFFAAAIPLSPNATPSNNRQETIFINHSAALATRLQHWESIPVNVAMYSLTRLPTVMLN